MSVHALARELYVCEMTVRRDLKSMSDEGYIQRYNGGAIYNSDEVVLPISDRKLLHSKEKMRLARKALPYLHDGMTVFIDCSSTCNYIIPLLADFKSIKVITNSVYNLLLAAKYNIPCTVIGGTYQNADMCMAGGLACRIMSEFNTDIAFLSALGISDDGEITDSNEPLTEFRKVVLGRSEKSVFLMSNQKQSKKYLYKLCTKDDVDAVFLE